MAGRSYFLTGALGCIGAWIVKELVERGDTPVVFDRSDERRRLHAILDDGAIASVRFVRGDISDRRAVRQALEASGATRVIHLAGLQVPSCRADPVAGAQVNVLGTLHVFEAVKDLRLPHLVYASSAAVFGLADEAVDETVVPVPLTHYGVFKQANEGAARVYYTDSGISSVGLRPYSVYGVGRDAGLTSDPTRAMKAALLGRPFQIRFSGLTDFIYVADTAAAFIACADRAPEGAQVFNLHGDTRDVGDVASLVGAELGAPARDLITVAGPPIPMPPALDGSALRALIPELPGTRLEEGVRETLARFAALRDTGRLDTSDLDEPAATGAASSRP